MGHMLGYVGTGLHQVRILVFENHKFKLSSAFYLILTNIPLLSIGMSERISFPCRPINFCDFWKFAFSVNFLVIRPLVVTENCTLLVITQNNC